MRVGVIGVGYLGRHHARIYSEIDGVELVGVADTDRDKAEEIAVKHGCRHYSDYAELIGSCDCLSIVTPTTTHYEIALACIRAGKDILIEKPITAKVEEAEEVIREAEARGLILQVGHLERYNPGVSAAMALVEKPHFIEAERLSPFLGRATDVDVTIDLMIHDIDIILGMAGSRVKEIKAAGEAGIVSDSIDVAKAWIEFENGTVAVVSASRIAEEKKRILRIYQKGSYVQVDYQDQEVMRRCARAEGGLSCEMIRPARKEPLKEELIDFVESVKTRKRPRVSGREAVTALQIALAATDSIRGA